MLLKATITQANLSKTSLFLEGSGIGTSPLTSAESPAKKHAKNQCGNPVPLTLHVWEWVKNSSLRPLWSLVYHLLTNSQVASTNYGTKKPVSTPRHLPGHRSDMSDQKHRSLPRVGVHVGEDVTMAELLAILHGAPKTQTELLLKKPTSITVLLHLIICLKNNLKKQQRSSEISVSVTNL